jgi:hypothetical protein
MGGILGRISELFWPAEPESYTYEERILAALRQGDGDIARIIERVADDAMRADQAGGAWVVDVGIWGQELYRQEALKAFQEMLGRTLVLQVNDLGHCLVAPVAA